MITQQIYRHICSQDEIRKVTGYRRLSAQRRWLDKNGWVYTVNGLGEVVIARSQMEMKLNLASNQLREESDEPDWSAWNARS